MGFYYAAKVSGQALQKLYDKAWDSFSFYIDTNNNCFTIQRATATGGHDYWWSTNNGTFTPGHTYYIQITWNEAATPTIFGGVTLHVGVDTSPPTSYALGEGSYSPTNAWLNHSSYSANLGNTSNGAACSSSSTAAVDWLNGRIYTFREYNSIQSFTNGAGSGSWATDSLWWITASVPHATIVYDSASFAGLSGTTIHSSGSQATDATTYWGTTTVNNNTVMNLPGTTGYVKVPPTTNFSNNPAMAFDMDVYIPSAGQPANPVLLQKIDDSGYQWVISVDKTNDRLVVSRGTVNHTQDTWTTPVNSIPYNAWFNIQVLWNVGAGPSGTSPTVWMTFPGGSGHYQEILAEQAQGSGNWATGSANWLYIGNSNANSYNSGMPLLLGYFAWYNYAIDTTTLNNRYLQFSSQFSTQNITCEISVDTSNNAPVSGGAFTVSGYLTADGAAFSGKTVTIKKTISGTTTNFGSGATTTTDSNGYFEMSGSVTPLGACTITASFTGYTSGTDVYSSASNTVDVTVVSAIIDTTLTITANNPSPTYINSLFTVSGVLNDVSSNHLSGKTITLTIIDQYNNSIIFGSAVTAADGSYSFINVGDTTPGTYTFNAAFAGDTTYAPIDSGDALTVTVENLVIVPTSISLAVSDDNPTVDESITISGLLTFGAEIPIESATITLTVTLDEDVSTQTTTTSALGAYSFTFTESSIGDYSIVVSYAASGTYSGCESHTTLMFNAAPVTTYNAWHQSLTDPFPGAALDSRITTVTTVWTPNVIVKSIVALTGTVETDLAIETFRPHFCKTIYLRPVRRVKLTLQTGQVQVGGTWTQVWAPLQDKFVWVKTGGTWVNSVGAILYDWILKDFNTQISRSRQSLQFGWSNSAESIETAEPLVVGVDFEPPVLELTHRVTLRVSVGIEAVFYTDQIINLKLRNHKFSDGSFKAILTPFQDYIVFKYRAIAQAVKSNVPNRKYVTVPMPEHIAKIKTTESFEFKGLIDIPLPVVFDSSDGRLVGADPTGLLLVAAAALNPNFLYSPPASAHKVVDYTLEVRKRNASTGMYDLQGVIDGRIQPSLTQELGLADVLSFNMQLSDQKTLMAADFKVGNEIWYYGRDARLKGVFVIQKVEQYRDYGATHSLGSGGNTLGAGSGENLLVVAGGPETYLGWVIIEKDYHAVNKRASGILGDLLYRVMANGWITGYSVDASLNIPLDITISWENVKTAIDSVVKLTGGFARIYVDSTNPLNRTLQILPSGSTPGTYFETTYPVLPAARRFGDHYKVDEVGTTDFPIVIYDVFPKTSDFIQNDGGSGGLSCEGLIYGAASTTTLKSGATAAVFETDTEFIHIPSCPEIMTRDAITIEFCAFIDNQASNASLFSKGQDKNHAFSIVYKFDTGQLVISRGTTGAVPNDVDIWITDPATPITAGDWYYIQVLWNSGSGPSPDSPPTVIIDNVIMDVKQDTDGAGDWISDYYYDIYLGNTENFDAALVGMISFFRLYSTFISAPSDNFIHDGWRRESAAATLNYDNFPQLTTQSEYAISTIMGENDVQ
jgi:hypothetical protein